MVREFVSLYESNRGGRGSELKEMRIQYADFAVWQRRWMEAGELDRQMSYWKQRLKGIAMLELPTDRAEAGRGVTPWCERGVQAGRRANRGVRKQMSRREGVTLYMSMLAGLAVVLSRYSGQQDIAVGTAIAGRNRAEVEGLIGFFVNTLVMRTEVRGEQSVRELMREVKGRGAGSICESGCAVRASGREDAAAAEFESSGFVPGDASDAEGRRRTGADGGVRVSSRQVMAEAVKFDIAVSVIRWRIA